MSGARFNDRSRVAPLKNPKSVDDDRSHTQSGALSFGAGLERMGEQHPPRPLFQRCCRVIGRGLDGLRPHRHLGPPMIRWTLDAMGWRPALEQERLQSAQGLSIGRVAVEYGGLYRVIVPEDGAPTPKVSADFNPPSPDRPDRDHGTREITAALPGKWRQTDPLDVPAVGDWVAMRGSGDGFAIEHRFNRRTQFLRQAAGKKPQPQVVGANVDVVFVVTGLDDDFNPRRVERYLSAILDGGAEPVVVLSKADLVDNIEAYRAALGPIGESTPIEVVSVHRHLGLDRLRARLGRGRTGALTGSSGVGKSTIVNALLGKAVQRTQAVRQHDSRGRHTTTHRELILLRPDDGLLVDTPGMRELQLWAPKDGIDRAFADVYAWAEQCRFRDCRHQGEPGCAVDGAVHRGELSEARKASYLRLREEEGASNRGRDGVNASSRPRSPARLRSSSPRRRRR